MASFGFAHEMPPRVVHKGGLYDYMALSSWMKALWDSLLMRWSSCKGLCATNGWRVTGGSTPKSWEMQLSFLMQFWIWSVNAFAFCHTDIDRSDLATVFCQAVSQRMHSENVQWSGDYRFPTFDWNWTFIALGRILSNEGKTKKRSYCNVCWSLINLFIFHCETNRGCIFRLCHVVCRFCIGLVSLPVFLCNFDLPSPPVAGAYRLGCWIMSENRGFKALVGCLI